MVFKAFIGLAFTKDGVHVMEKLVGASYHDHLVRLALFPFHVVVFTYPAIRLAPRFLHLSSISSLS